jgi:hypothetical protein
LILRVTNFTTEYTEVTEELQRPLCCVFFVNFVHSVVKIAIAGFVGFPARALLNIDER